MVVAAIVSISTTSTPATATATATARTAIAQLLGRRLLSRLFPRSRRPECSSRDVAVFPSCAVTLAVGDTSVASQQTRQITIACGRRSRLGHGASRHKATVKTDSEVPPGYVSPYADFFANVAQGRTSLGTTEETERRAHALRERRLACGVRESALRFRTTSYGRFMLPPYVAHGEHRVTVKVALAAIPFENDREREVFRQLVGPRFNEEGGDLKLSSEKFASRIENKRYLVDQIERIVSGARTLAKEFADGEMPRDTK